jgi:hypothetical protein
MSKTFSGIYKPRNPQKYKGDFRNICYRSSWEFMFMRKLDEDPTVDQWSSEEIIINYKSPIDGRNHRYFPDFLVIKKDKTYLIEVKPKKQTKPPQKKKKITKSYIREVATYGINEAKWEAAKEYCKKRHWNFVILTEVELGLSSG